MRITIFTPLLLCLPFVSSLGKDRPPNPFPVGGSLMVPHVSGKAVNRGTLNMPEFSNYQGYDYKVICNYTISGMQTTDLPFISGWSFIKGSDPEQFDIKDFNFNQDTGDAKKEIISVNALQGTISMIVNAGQTSDPKSYYGVDILNFDSMGDITVSDCKASLVI